MEHADDGEDDSGHNIYKFLNKDNNTFETSDKRNTFTQGISPNIYIEIDEKKRQKTYAILQEARSEFIANSRLRTLLLIYSNIAFQLFILTTLAIAYVIDTCIYTFNEPSERPIWCIIILICCNFIFAFDVAIIIGLKFSKKWRKSLNLVEPSTFKLVLNVILAMPYPFLYLINENALPFRFHQIAPLVATIRVYRIIEYFYHRSSQAGSNQWTTFLSQYLVLFFLSVHTWTCLWYLFANKSFSVHKIRTSWSIAAVFLPTESTSDWYFVCMYWSVMSFTTNCLGDLYPVTITERLVAILGVLIGFLLTIIVYVGSLTSQFITITTRRSNYVRKLKKIMNHLKLIGMDKATTKRIIQYYKDLWSQKSGVFQPKLLRLLPYPLQMEICYDLNAVPLYSSLIFRKLPEAFLRRLSLDMSHQFYLPGDVVYSHGQNKTIMVCVTSGVIELLSDEDDESPMISFTKGTCFGEISLVYNIPARCTVKAATYVECQVLEKTKFIKLMITYPNIIYKIRNEIDDRINRCRIRKHNQDGYTEFSLNIYAYKDRKKSSIKCLKDKLRYIQGKSDIDTLTNEDQLDETCLDLYIISNHVKRKIEKFLCMKSHFPWILEADCPLVTYWELYILAIVCYICIAYPYFIGFARKFPDGFYFTTQIIITISLILNIFITSITAVKSKKIYKRTFKDIISYRMNTLGFYLDILAIVPFEYMVAIHTRVYYYDNYREHLFYLCKGIKLCLVWRLSSFFEKLERNLLHNTLLIKVVKYCVYLFFLCYWSGVILYMESCFVSRCAEDSWFSNAITWDDQKYTHMSSKTKYPIITAVYFASSILLSVSYGDFAPGDIYDMTFVAFLSLYGVLLIGYFVSEFSSVVTHWSRTKTAFLEIIITMDKFMKDNNMHRAIKNRIMAFYELQWQYNSGMGLTDYSWLEKTVVPAELRKKVLHQARFKALTSIKFFQVKNTAYIHTLTESARDVILPPGEIVHYAGTVSRELYIIEKGYCMVTNKHKKQRILGPGEHAGLLVLLYGVPTMSTVVTLTHCKLVSVSYSAYISALSLFPEMKEHDGILSPEILNTLNVEAKLHKTDSYLVHDRNMDEKKQRVKIRGLLQEFFNNSFIDLRTEYKKKEYAESYLKSYKQFNFLNNVAPYLLLPYTIKPDGIFIKAWTLIRFAAAYWLCLLIPITVAMAPLFSAFNIPLIVLESICYLDWYLMLHVAYYGPKNQLIYHPYMTAKHYLTGQFVIDFLTSFPWYALWKLLVTKHDESHTAEEHTVNNHMYHCSLRMINLLQIVKLFTINYSDSIRGLKREYIMSVIHFLLITLLCLSFYTSVLITISCRYVLAKDPEDLLDKISKLQSAGSYMVPKFHPDGNMVCHEGFEPAISGSQGEIAISDSWVNGVDKLKDYSTAYTKIYLLAYYWAASSFSGAGFGDIVPQNVTHMLLTLSVNLHGVLFFGYVYAKIASLKALGDQVVTKFQENLKHFEMFLNRENVPLALRKTVMEYWKYQWKRTGGWSHQSILGNLHANLNEDAVLYMYEKTLSEIPLFEDVEYSFFRAFAKKLKEYYFLKGYMVMRSNEVIEMMYIIFRGKVDIVTNINEVEACMGPGGIFGNIKGAAKYLTMSNVIASRNIDLLCIKGRDFYALLKSYPSVYKKVMMSVGSATKDYVLPTVMSTRNSTEQSFPLTYETGEEEDCDLSRDPDILYESPQKSVSESHGSRSITSATNLDYTAATLLIFKPHRWFRSSIIPDCKLVLIMEYVILIIAYFDFMLLVYQMSFLSIPYYLYICIVSDILFLYKVFLDIHCGYMNRYGDYILNPKKVRKMYFSKVYIRRRDFLANFLICYVVPALPLNEYMKMALFSYTRTPQLIRISYLFTYKTHSKSSIGPSNLFFKLTSIAVVASIISHVTACLFFKLSCLTPVHCTSSNWMSKDQLNLRAKYSEENYFALYVTALWYMINLLTITGTGDVSSQNSFESVETIIIIILIKFSTGLLISETSAMITAHSSSRIAYDYDINELRDGLCDMNLSCHQLDKMWAYVRELWNRQQGKQMPSLVYKLPFRLRCQVMQAVYGSHIRESVIFRKTDDDFRRMLIMWMKHCVFFPGNYIVQCGDSDQCIYFIHRGQVEVLTVHANLTESIYDVLGPEDSFGVAQGLFVGVQHHFSFRARTVVDIVYLKLDEWKYLLDHYPKAAKIVSKKVENVYLVI